MGLPTSHAQALLSRSTPFVAMMQATHLCNLHNGSNLRPLQGTGVGSILAQRQMSARLLVVFKVAAQNLSQVLLSQHDDVVQALPPNGTDQSLRKSVLPRALWCGEHFDHAHFCYAVPELLTVNSIAVADQVPRCTIMRKCFAHLLSDPCGRRMLSDVEVRSGKGQQMSDDVNAARDERLHNPAQQLDVTFVGANHSLVAVKLENPHWSFTPVAFSR